MFKRMIPASLAGLLVLAACNSTPTSGDGVSRDGASFDEGGWGYGSGGWSQDDSSAATASTDSVATERGGGAIGSGN